MTGTSPKQPSVVDDFKIEKKGTKPSVVTAEDISEENTAAEEEEEWLEHDHRECDRIRTEARNRGIFGRLSYPCREVKQLPPPPPPCMAMEEDLLDLDHPTSIPFQPPLPLSDFTSFSINPFPRSVEADGTDCFAGCGSNTSAIGGSFK
ncbi:hypothetical protein M0R45_025151 [Rubus argutus]|uniref:Uncharacterized protein n=1 Tax=Rubus argutus TaxID=59490 RepID=A0AAW1WUU4_RUBAR